MSLKKWFAEKWVDIGSKRKDGSFAPCGRTKQKKDAKRKYPKCVPSRVASTMSDSQRRSAVRRKRQAESKVARDGKKPIMVSTFKKSNEGLADKFIYEDEGE